jgi:hypothetical protein
MHRPGSNRWLAVAIALMVVLAAFGPARGVRASAGITVDFTSSVRTIDPMALSMDESEYGNGNYLTNDSLEQQRVTTLHPKLVRLDLHYAVPGDPTSAIVCGAAGCDTSISGDTWVNAVKATGAQPVVIVTMKNTVDGPNLVKHFNIDTHNYVGRWIVGNEPDINGVSATTYSNTFNTLSDAMKAVDPTIKVGGATTAWFDQGFISTFLTISGSRTDFVDFHQYGEGGTTNCPLPNATLLANTASFENNLNTLHSMIVQYAAARASQIEMEVGEWNLNYGAGCSDPNHMSYMNFNTVWSASVIGHILNAGGIDLYYATKGGGGGALYDHVDTTAGTGGVVDDPMPSYHGAGMFTGEGLFAAFGTTLVSSSTSLSNMEVFASSNTENIVVVNKDPSVTQNVTVSLNGASAAQADVWSKDGSMNVLAPPAHMGTVAIANGTFSYSFPPYSVTRFILTGQSPPTNTPTPTSTPLPPAQTNTIEDNFTRSNQTGWGSSTNTSSVSNIAWGMQGNGSAGYVTINNNTGHYGYPGATSQVGIASAGNSTYTNGDSLVKFEVSAVGHAIPYVVENACSSGSCYYGAALHTSQNRFEIRRRSGGATSVLVGTPFTANANTFYWMRLDVSTGTTGNTLSAKIWQDGSPEPAAWTITATDPAPLAANYAGAGGTWDQTGTGEYISYACYAYATGGLAKPCGGDGSPGPTNTPTQTSTPSTLTATPTNTPVTPVPPTKTPTLTYTPVPTSTSPPTGTMVRDSFNRSVASGWGDADIGGTWSISTTPSTWSVSPSAGSIETSGFAEALATLPVTALNVDCSESVTLPVGTDMVLAYVLVREQPDGSYYRIGVGQGPSGMVVIRGQTSTGTYLFTDVSTGIPAAAGNNISFRVQVQGTSPTTIRARAWITGTPEPTTWMVTTTNSTAAQQAPGLLGVRVRNQGATSVTVQYESFLAKGL